MKWIEMIRVRSASDALPLAMPEITSHADKIGRGPGIIEVMVLQHALFDGDIAVVILWDDDRQPKRTTEGLLLAGHLQNFGLVDHGVWVATPGFARCFEQEPRP